MLTVREQPPTALTLHSLDAPRVLIVFLLLPLLHSVTHALIDILNANYLPSQHCSAQQATTKRVYAARYLA